MIIIKAQICWMFITFLRMTCLRNYLVNWTICRKIWKLKIQVAIPSKPWPRNNDFPPYLKYQLNLFSSQTFSIIIPIIAWIPINIHCESEIFLWRPCFREFSRVRVPAETFCLNGVFQTMYLNQLTNYCRNTKHPSMSFAEIGIV